MTIPESLAPPPTLGAGVATISTLAAAVLALTGALDPATASYANAESGRRILGRDCPPEKRNKI
jgi:hypothetical protein